LLYFQEERKEIFGKYYIKDNNLNEFIVSSHKEAHNDEIYYDLFLLNNIDYIFFFLYTQIIESNRYKAFS